MDVEDTDDVLRRGVDVKGTARDEPPGIVGRPVRGSSTGRPIMALLDLLGRRWTLRIIWELHLSSPCPLTFRGLQQRCENMSSSVLNHRLGELRDARLVASVTGGYSLTAHGADLIALLLPLDAWAKNWSSKLTPSTS